MSENLSPSTRVSERPTGVRLGVGADQREPVYWRVEGSLLQVGAMRPVGFFTWNSQSFSERWARRLGMAGKLLFPIPDRGLAQRLYRITARTLIIWGREDVLIPPVYGDAFKKAISKSKLVRISKAGHAVGQERPAAVLEAIRTFF